MTLNTDPGARIDCIAAVRPKVLAMDRTWKSVRLKSHCSAAARGGRIGFRVGVGFRVRVLVSLD